MECLSNALEEYSNVQCMFRRLRVPEAFISSCFGERIGDEEIPRGSMSRGKTNPGKWVRFSFQPQLHASRSYELCVFAE